jgi:peptidoglycan hydrolase-like protein with peptidoglycan-binding domain
VYDGNGLLKYKDSFLEVVDYDNGYNGCVDPEPFFDTPLPPFVFNRNLWFGTKSLDNVELQRRLGVSPTDLNFGPKTLAAVMKYQLTNGITPSHGFVGPITRAKLNAGS